MKQAERWGVLFVVILLGLSFSAGAATDLSSPFSLEMTRYTRDVITNFSTYGDAVALSESFMIVGMPGANTNKGGYAIYRKTPAMTWVLAAQHYSSWTQSYFGLAVAIDQDTAVVGAPYHDYGGFASAGAALIVEKGLDGFWSSRQELLPTNPGASQNYGYAVAVDGSCVAVGANGEDSVGAVHIFMKDSTGWTETQILKSPGGVTTRGFGDRLAMQGDWLAISDMIMDVGTQTAAGAVFLYKKINNVWVYEATMTGQPTSHALYGVSLALDGNRLLVGALAMFGHGIVYAYDLKIAYTYQQMIQENPPEAGSDFGRSVGLDGDLAVIGVSSHSSSNVGKVIVYQWQTNSWVDAGELPSYGLTAGAQFGSSVAVKRNHILASAPWATVYAHVSEGLVFGYDVAQTKKIYGTNAWDYLGRSVAINDSRAVIGIRKETAGGVNSAGAVDIYRRRGRNWIREQKLIEPLPDRAAGNHFGQSVSMGRNTLMVGAPYGDIVFTNAGKIYLYERTGTTWSNVFEEGGGHTDATIGNQVVAHDYLAVARAYDPTSAIDYLSTWYRTATGWWSLGIDLGPGVLGSIGYGNAIALHGNLMLVGAPQADSGQGKAFLYRWKGPGTGWAVVTNILPVFWNNESFGSAVALTDTHLAIGAPDKASGEGIVDIYEISGDTVAWEYLVRAPDVVADDDFGNSLAFANNGNTLIVGSNKRDEYGKDDLGCVYAFNQNANGTMWNFDMKILPPNDGHLDDYDYFGSHISAFGSTLIVGADKDDTPSANTGSATILEILPRVAPADFDGDGITDIGCYYPPSGTWYVFQSGNAHFWTTDFGYAGTTPFVGDFDGDWKADFGCFDPASGTWFVYQSSDGFKVSQFGNIGATSFTGDFDGDGLMDQGFFDASIPKFFFMGSSLGYWAENFGTAGGDPVTGDFDGDGIDDFGTYNAPAGLWQIRRSRDGDWQTNFGYAGTEPITGDFDGDTIEDFGCYYPPTGSWYIFKSRDGFWVNNFGYGGTIPVTGDFDGDGIDDFGCYYPPPGAWYVYKSTEGFWVNNFGYSGTVPMN